MIDSTDRLRTCVIREELSQLLGHDDIRNSNIPVLFFANKVSEQVIVTAKRIIAS